MNRLALYASVSLATVLVVLLLFQFRLAVAVVVLSLSLTVAVRPLIAAIAARGVSRTLAMILVYLSGLILLGLLVAWLGSALIAELPILGEDLARAYEQLHPAWNEGLAWQQALIRRLPSPDRLYASISGAGGELLARRLLGFTRGLVTIAGFFVLTAILSIYWSSDRARFEQLWLSFLPSRQRTLVRNIWHGIEGVLAVYIRSEVMQSLLAVLALSAGYQLLNLSYPTILALLGTLAWFVPLVGFLLALPPVVASGIMSGTATTAIAVLYTLLVFMVLEYVVEPRFRQGRRFNPILTILAMLVLIDSFGLLGLILAPPLAAMVQTTLAHTLGRRNGRPRMEAGLRLPDLRQDLTGLRATLSEMDDDAAPEVLSLADRLEGLLQLAEEVTVEPAGETSRGQSRPS